MDRMRVHPLAELCVTAVDEDTIAELNQQWMDKEGPTDVLAFPMDELRPGLVNDEPEEGVLGDLVLCPSVAERQATTAGHSTATSSTCSPSTASCTCSATTMPSPRSTRRCSGCRPDCWPSGSARADRRVERAVIPMTVDRRWPGRVAAVLVVLAAVLTTIEAALSSFSRARAVELSPRDAPRRRVGCSAPRRPAALPQRPAGAASALRDAAMVLVTAMVLGLLDADAGPRFSPRSG